MTYNFSDMPKIRERWKLTTKMSLRNRIAKNGYVQKVKIVRHLDTDLFDIWYSWDPDWNNLYKVHVFVDGKLKGEIHANNLLVVNDPVWGKHIKIHNMQFGEPELSKVHNLTIIAGDDSYASSVNIKIEKGNFSKVIDVPNGKVGIVEAMRSFEVISQPWAGNANQLDQASVSIAQTNVGLKDFIYEPLQINREDNVSEIANIYLADSIESPNDEIKDERYKYVTTNFPKGLSAYTKRNARPSSVITLNNQENGNRSVKYFGTAVIDQSTDYDYEKKKTINENVTNGKKGDIIPFSFKGDYEFACSLTFWKSFEDILFRTIHHYDFPILDENEGKYILNIKESSEKLSTTMILPEKVIEDIIKDKSQYSLRALKRASLEKVN